MASNEPDLFTHQILEELPTSVGELAPGHKLLLGLCDLGINARVRSHSIIADVNDPPCPGATDGIVPYWSSHLDGVTSESIVHGLHICLNHPEVIQEVRRILMEHAGTEVAPRSSHQMSRRIEIAAPVRSQTDDCGTTERPTEAFHGVLDEVEP
jgi:hypothetical protein